MVEKRNMNIWIDLDNSPHVPLFLPIIQRFEDLGHSVIITSREFAQTQSLLNKSNITHECIGGYPGKNKLKKIWGTSQRSWYLFKHIKNLKVDIAISHGSRSQVIAAKIMGIPSFIGFDYEFTETRIFNLLSTKMWVPTLIPDTKLTKVGINLEKIIKYSSLKEEIYINHFVPDPDFLRSNNIPSDKVLVILRPPSTTANYYDDKSELLLKHLIKRLLSGRDIYTICLPRDSSQARLLSSYEREQKFEVADRTYAGLDLIWNSDLVISGGGTMLREAALLGVPTYSIFTGIQGCIDSHLENSGQIVFIRNVSDLNKINLERRNKSSKNLTSDNNIDLFIVNEALKVAI